MKFFCIKEPKLKSARNSSPQLLRASCEERGIEYIEVNPETFDFSKQFKISKKDAIYRASVTKDAKIVERLLLMQTPKSFYKSIEVALSRLDNPMLSLFMHQKAKLPVIPTIFSLPKKENVSRAVAKLGGFPIIIKALGGRSGIGVMRFDSLASLNSAIDYLDNFPGANFFILRKYIDHKAQIRATVLGTRVIAAKTNLIGDDDFRTNVSKELKQGTVNLSQKLRKIIVKSVSSLGLEFGAVDILSAKDGNHYLAEVNFPCNFAPAQKFTGVDISGQMIDYLSKKASN